MIRSKNLYQSLLLSAFLLLPISAFAASIAVIPTSGGGAAVVASGFDGVSALDVTVGYDTMLLSNAAVSAGPALNGALFQANPNFAAGKLRFVAVSSNPIKNGTLATINFNQLSDSIGTLTATGLVTNSLGVKLKNVAFIGYTPPGVAGSQTVAQTDTPKGTRNDTQNDPQKNTQYGTQSPPPSGTTTPYTVGGTLTMPTEEPAAKEQREQPYQQPYQQPENSEPTAAVAAREPAPVSGDPRDEVAVLKAPVTPAAPVPSVLERFRTFQGERTVKGLTDLFDRSAFANFSQNPPVAIADGVEVVQVSISKVTGEKAPNFAFSSARYVSLTKGADGEWLIAVKPDKKAVDASISMLMNGTTQEFPLAVAPKARVDLIKAGQVTEADFQLFLKERGTPDAPKHDLNGDGKRDYLDDYIFTANYLVQREQALRRDTEKEKPRPRPQAER